jgi:hypothetical protein
MYNITRFFYLEIAITNHVPFDHQVDLIAVAVVIEEEEEEKMVAYGAHSYHYHAPTMDV